MSFLTGSIPMVIYAVGFQTVVYLLLSNRFKVVWAPFVTGLVGGILVLASATVFGWGTVGWSPPDGGLLAAWGAGTLIVFGVIGLTMLSRSDLREHLADPRVAAQSVRQFAAQVLFRIPVMTALIEEAVFRGVLHAALIAVYPAPIALWGGAALFGLWHIGPGLDQAKAVDRRNLASVAHVLVTVIATTIAGAGLVWLRIETGSIWVPVAVHAGLNMTMAVFARLASRPIAEPATPIAEVA
jgi:CAAX protease family protein